MYIYIFAEEKERERKREKERDKKPKCNVYSRAIARLINFLEKERKLCVFDLSLSAHFGVSVHILVQSKRTMGGHCFVAFSVSLFL